MNRTVLEICQAALYDIGITPPTSLLSTTDSAQIQLKNILYTQARALRNMCKMAQQKRKYSFMTRAGRSIYPFPQDFYAIAGNTAYDRSSSEPIYGPMGDEEVNDLRYGLSITGTPYAVRPFGLDFNSATGSGQFELTPTPEENVEISFDYYTSTLFLPPHWVASTAYTTTAPDRVNANGYVYACTTNGTSGSIPPDYYVRGDGVGIGRDNTVIWAFVPNYATATLYQVGEYVNANSNVYKCTVSGVSSSAPSHTSGTATDGTVTWEFISTPGAWAAGTSYAVDDCKTSNSKYFRCLDAGISGASANSPNFTASLWGEKGSTNAPIWDYQEGPYETIVLNTDLCIYDDDVMIAGVKYRYQQSKNLAYQADPVTGESLEYKRLLNRALGRFSGSFIGSLTGNRWRGPRYFVNTRGLFSE